MPEGMRYGFKLDEWTAAKREIRSMLIAHARRRETTTYGEVCARTQAIELKPYSFAMMGMLNEVCADEDAARGVMLASLVVRKAEGIPGDGYFTWAGKLGRDVSDRRAFWESEVARVFAAFSGEDGGPDA